MAIREYVKDGKKLYKVYVNERGKKLKRIRIQRIISGLDSINAARREEKKLLKEVTEAVAKLEGRGLTWSEIIYRWEISARGSLEFGRLNVHSIADHVHRLERYTDLWALKVASDLTRADGRHVINLALSKGISPSLLRRIRSSINLVYTWGLEEGFIQHNSLSGKSPVHGLVVGGKEDKVKPILTLDEVRKLLLEAKARKHPWYPIWAIAVSTGMRSGELQALEWGDIDEKNGIIRVSKSFNKRINGMKCPKNGTWRNVDINSQLKELLKELRRERAHEQFVLPHFPEWKYGDAGKVLRLFLEGIGIKKRVVFHTLRACFATHLLSTGVEPLKVMRMGGWSDLKTFQIYLRLSGIDVKGVAEALDVIPSSDTTLNVIPLFS